MWSDFPLLCPYFFIKKQLVMKNPKAFLRALSICLCLSLLTYSTALWSQTTSIGASAEVAVPLFKGQQNITVLGINVPVDLSEDVNTGFGVSGRLQHDINSRAALMVQAGYLKFDKTTFANFGDVGNVLGNLTNLKASVTAIPVQAGVKVYLVEGLYGMAEAGIHHITTKLNANALFVNADANEKRTELSVAPGIGYELDLGRVNLDLAARYQYVHNNASYVGLSAGFNLPVYTKKSTGRRF